ncbi:MAG: NYN domain-containing protein [Chloroflexota bacterium]|nr:NYN domain-containing protein [Chloroflexota bacterium]
MNLHELRKDPETKQGYHGDVALYIDWENIKYSLWNRDGRAPNALALKEAASAYGRVVVAKAYANWQEAQHQADPNDLYSAGIEPIYVPTRTYASNDSMQAAIRRKNSVDVKLTVDAVDYCLMNPNIRNFVLVTGDGDFIHLVNSLRSRGKQVIVIGCSWSTSWQLTSTADYFIPYDVDVDPLHAPDTGEPGQPDAELERAFEMLVHVMHDIRREGEPNVFAQIKLMLLSRLGHFDERQHGFARFKDFMREAERRGLVKTYTVGLIDRAYLPDEQIELGIATQEHELELSDSEARQSVSAMGDVAQTTVSSLGDDERGLLNRLVRFLDELEHNSPYMSFNFMAERAYESSGLPLSISEIAALLNTAIEDSVFKRDTKTVWNRATNEYRDINIFKLNRSHEVVSDALSTETVGLEPASS